MPCPVCDGTMQCLTLSGASGKAIYWCPRCGTLRFRSHDGDWTEDESPKLVERCQRFEETALRAEDRPEWDRLGIHEAIRVKETT